MYGIFQEFSRDFSIYNNSNTQMGSRLFMQICSDVSSVVNVSFLLLTGFKAKGLMIIFIISANVSLLTLSELHYAAYH